MTSFKSTKIEFMVGEVFDEFTADGRECKTVATIEDRKLIKVGSTKIKKILFTIYFFVLTLNTRFRPRTPAQVTTLPGR